MQEMSIYIMCIPTIYGRAIGAGAERTGGEGADMGGENLLCQI